MWFFDNCTASVSRSTQDAKTEEEGQDQADHSKKGEDPAKGRVAARLFFCGVVLRAKTFTGYIGGVDSAVVGAGNFLNYGL